MNCRSICSLSLADSRSNSNFFLSSACLLTKSVFTESLQTWCLISLRDSLRTLISSLCRRISSLASNKLRFCQPFGGSSSDQLKNPWTVHLKKFRPGFASVQDLTIIVDLPQLQRGPGIWIWQFLTDSELEIWLIIHSLWNYVNNRGKQNYTGWKWSDMLIMANEARGVKFKFKNDTDSMLIRRLPEVIN